MEAKTPKEIIKNVAEHAELKVGALSRLIGYERPQILYDILNEKTKTISADVANRIAEKFPNISLEWLLTGKGTMIRNNQTAENPNSSGIVGNNVFGGGINDATIISGLMKTLEKKDEQMDMLMKASEKKDEQIDRLMKIIENQRS